MNKRQLSDRIGNVDDKLVAEASGRAPKKSRVWQRIAAAAAALALVIGVGAWLATRGAPTVANATDLMEGYKAQVSADSAALTDESAAKAADFGLRLLKQCDEGGNVLISPYSILSALGMTALGARGETLTEMADVLGMEPEALAAYLRAYGESITGDKVSIANSIWMRDTPSLHVEPDFLQKNADYYAAGAYAAPFDASTVKDINAWVKKNTHNMIPTLLDEIPEDAVMYLINALAFEAKWASPYKTKAEVLPAIFTTDAGEERTVTMMYGGLDGYFADEMAQGFLKLYKGGDYAFAAILPEEGVTVEEYLAALTGEKLHALLAGAQDAYGHTGIPKFTIEGDYELEDYLSNLGMPTAFDGGRADFTGLGTSDLGNLYISRVLHKTFMEVAEEGTRAAAVTSVEMKSEGAAEPPEIMVILNRPFICLIVDTTSYMPLFLAVVRDIGE